MISTFDIAKALRDQADVIATANSFTLVGNGEKFEPKTDESHIEEIVLFGDDETVGLANDSSDIQFGVYQLSVHTPKNDKKWPGLKKIDILKAGFPRGNFLTFNGQQIVLENSSLSPMMQNKTHLIHHLSINFSVIN